MRPFIGQSILKADRNSDFFIRSGYEWRRRGRLPTLIGPADARGQGQRHPLPGRNPRTRATVASAMAFCLVISSVTLDGVDYGYISLAYASLQSAAEVVGFFKRVADS